MLSGFGLILGLLLAGSEVLLPGWWWLFAGAVKEYHRYTGNRSIIQVLTAATVGSESLASSAISVAVLVIAILVTGMLLWKLRSKSSQTDDFGCAMALALALTVVIVPMYAPYNQVLLLPSILLLVRKRKVFLAGPRLHRMVYWVGGLLLLWQWAASLAVGLIELAGSQPKALELWRWPLFSTFVLPVWIFGLTLFYARREQSADKTVV